MGKLSCDSPVVYCQEAGAAIMPVNHSINLVIKKRIFYDHDHGSFADDFQEKIVSVDISCKMS